MNGLDLVVDTNIFVYLTSGNKNVHRAVQGNNLFVSFITEMELLSRPTASSREIQLIKELLSQCKIISLNDDIKKIAIDIRRRSKLRLPDAIVAATSIYMKVPLISADREFKKVNELELILLSV
jgi:predicted nucleic acid-binding protein